MDVFDRRDLQPMLFGREEGPFDDPEYFFELKLDGLRCLAYLEPASTVLINKVDKLLLPRFPELRDLHRRVKKRCLLDGELIITKDGRPDFDQVIRRSVMSRKLSVDLAVKRAPANFVAFDLLYLGDKELLNVPLHERKGCLAANVSEDERLVLSRVVEERGLDFFGLVQAQGLEGIVGKKKDSLYFSGKRTRDWVKIKNILDDDFVICGYLLKSGSTASLILGQYKLSGLPDPADKSIIKVSGEMIYKGHVSVGTSGPDFKFIINRGRASNHPFSVPPPAGDKSAIWLKPDLVCRVQFLARNTKGGLRHPVFVGLRLDKSAPEAVDFLNPAHQ